MPQVNIKKVRRALEQAAASLHEMRQQPYLEVGLFDQEAEDKLAAARGRALSHLDRRAEALDAVAVVRSSLVRAEVESGLVATEQERTAAIDYLEEAEALLAATQELEDGPGTPTLSDVHKDIAAAQQQRVRFPVIAPEEASVLEDKIAKGKQVLVEMEDRIEELLISTRVEIADEHRNVLKAIGVVL